MSAVMEHSASAQGQGCVERAQARRVYTLPIRAIQARDGGERAGEVYRTIYTAKFIDGGIDIRVDWNGSDEHFQILGQDDVWHSLDDIAVDRNNPVVQPEAQPPDVTFQARFRRGPWGSKSKFKVKLVEIAWNGESGALVDWLSDPGFTAVRDEHYTCSADPEATQTHESAADYEGEHQLTIELQSGRDYEVSVELWHPTEEQLTHVIDPIVRGGDQPV